MSLYDDSRKSGPESSFETFYDPTLYGWPANVHNDTGTFQSLGPRILQKQAESLYFSATGETLDATTTVSTGHKHDQWSTLLRWRQLGSWRPQGGKDNDAKEGFIHNLVEPRKFLWASFQIPISGSTLPQSYVIPRYRISNPAPGSSTAHTLQITSVVYFDDGGSLSTGSLVAPVPLYVTSTSSVSHSNVWFEGAPIDLQGPGETHFFWQLTASLDTDGPESAIWEVQLGWYEG